MQLSLHKPQSYKKATDRFFFPATQMGSIEEITVVTKILVGLSLNSQASSELLSSAVEVVAHPNDTIVALHVLAVEEEENGLDFQNKKRLRQAKAFVISMLGEFAEICETKQVKLEAKVRIGHNIAKGLIDEAASIDANFLLVGGSRNRPQRNSFEITKYCFKHAPQGCLVIAVGKQGPPQHDTDLESVTCERNQSFSSTKGNRTTSLSKVLTHLQKLFSSSPKRDEVPSPSESVCEKSSPKAVLDGPEEASPVLEDCSSPSSNEISRRTYSRTNLWRRLSVTKLFFPFFRSADVLNGKDSDWCLSNTEVRKPSWRCFRYEEIYRATNGFHQDNFVGRGGFAEVYKGDLTSGQRIAVKRLAKDNTDENKEREFLIELGIISHVSHPNTVYLLGCCIENGFHLIFEFSSNGSLASALHARDGELLKWPIRYNIAIGIARGLHYLHKCCRRRIIHRDIKASNVLLGADFEPQISDFGLAKWLPRQWTHHSVIPIEGTFGYLAPEYFMHGIVDEKTDVFAFGVLLLEIVSGRRPVDSSKQSLILWAKPLLESGNVAELADPKLGDEYDLDQLQRLVLVASYCIRQSAMWRPTMSEVLEILMDDHNQKLAMIWRMPDCMADEMDDCSDLLDCYLPE